MTTHSRVMANDFAAQWAAIKDDALAAVDRVGRSGWLVLGEEVEAFETEFADWWGVGHAVGVASGLDALEIGLRINAIGPGARALTTSLTAFATTLAILRAGAEPVWCDVDETGSLDLQAADDALAADPRIKALVPVHLYGHPLDSQALEGLLGRHEIVLLEDCAQSAGACPATVDPRVPSARWPLRASTPRKTSGRWATVASYSPVTRVSRPGAGAAQLPARFSAPKNVDLPLRRPDERPAPPVGGTVRRRREGVRGDRDDGHGPPRRPRRT